MDHVSDSINQSSNLGQFAWEQWNDQFIAVIFRRSPNGFNRYVLKRYAEQVLFQSERWRYLSIYFSNITPMIRAYTLTTHEIQLMRIILNFHLNDRLHLRITQSNDKLIDYEDLLDFISQVEDDLHNKDSGSNNRPISQTLSSIPSIPIIDASCTPASLVINPTSRMEASSIVKNNYQRSIPSSTVSSVKSSIPSNIAISSMSVKNTTIDGNGWIQINHVFLPFIIKAHQRLVPYAILISCKILEPNQLRTTLKRATLADITLINSMIHHCNINNQFVAENTLLINVYHILMGINKIVYVKILPINNPTSQVNHQYKNVLSLHGGSLYIKSHLISFVFSNQHSYIPFNEVINIYPNLYRKLKCFTRTPNINELEYLQLVQMYYNKEKLLSNDTLLIDMKHLCQIDIILSKTISLIEYHGKEKIKFDKILALKMNASKKARNNQTSNKNKQVKKKFKTANQTDQSSSINFHSLAGYFPKPSTPYFYNQQCSLLSPNN